MTHNLFLIAPPSGSADQFIAPLSATLDACTVSALLLARGERTEDAYSQWARAIIPVAQGRNVAVLLEDCPELVAPLGADGVHITGPLAAAASALKALKPGQIVGAGAIGSRHDAMERGELGLDYLLFGDRGGIDGFELAQWWSETFEIPCVYLATSIDDPSIAHTRAEFLGLREAGLWTSPGRLAQLGGPP